MNRGEVWLINLDPTVGSEMKKTRPAVIVSDDSVGVLPLRVIVPITDWKPGYSRAPWMVRLEPDDQNGLTKISAADTFQVRSISTQRFVRQTGQVSDTSMERLAYALGVVLKIVP